ncbi:HdeD family acid-resistance protein [Alkalibacter saccharofermentans]|uniref:Acid-resistance membrane protein n=1 Tax=Alkalibacter saccharofermentans DSM 14828 TaxID=1120975 RepID=A0A1M4Z593_9FIRM|nr:DUF308 domain-containing protein [Alkalibacter saccharofermentans]SHF12756.1 Short repeat of unknown function [Alkalibacter saccharofermentans DSM 14828]
MNGFEKIKSFGIFFGISLIIAGAVFLMFPSSVIKFLAVLTGLLLAAFGLFKAVSSLLRWNELNYRVLHMAVGILLVLSGIFIIINTEFTISALGVVIGIFAILQAFDRFSVASSRRQAGLNYKPTVIFGVVHLGFGIGMFYSAFGMISIIVSLIGVYLLVSGVMVALSTAYFFDF